MPHLSLIALTFSLFATEQSFAQVPAGTTMSDLIPLRSCANSVSKQMSGERISSGWSSNDENSFYFLTCDDNYDLGDDQYVFTPNGVYYFFLKQHKDYKGGMEPTQFRLSIENKTYYFMTDIVSGMGELFDETGKNLDTSATGSAQTTYDVTSKNLALNYYMKTLVGKSDPKATVVALPVSNDRIEKAQSCIRKQLFQLGSSLQDVFTFRRDHGSIPEAYIQPYRTAVLNDLSAPACSVDPIVTAKFIELKNSL